MSATAIRFMDTEPGTSASAVVFEHKHQRSYELVPVRDWYKVSTIEAAYVFYK